MCGGKCRGSELDSTPHLPPSPLAAASGLPPSVPEKPIVSLTRTTRTSRPKWTWTLSLSVSAGERQGHQKAKELRRKVRGGLWVQRT